MEWQEYPEALAEEASTKEEEKQVEEDSKPDSPEEEAALDAVATVDDIKEKDKKKFGIQ